MKIDIDPTSCGPGAVSPYPYLDLANTSTDTTLTWHLTLSDASYTLYHNPPTSIRPGPGWTDFIAFVGSMGTTHPITVTFTGNIGYWSGTLQPCSVATPAPAPPPPLDVTITCASAAAGIDAKLCVHVGPSATVTAVVVYCDGQHEGDLRLANGLPTDGQGNVLFDWIPNTTCYGPATVTVSARDYQNRHGSASTTITVTGPPVGPTATPPPTPTPTP